MNYYNVEQAKLSTEQINEATTGIKTTITDNWVDVNSKFRTYWKGVDEEAFEKQLAKEIQNVYTNCQLMGSATNTFIIASAQSYSQFQSGLAQSMGGDAAQAIAIEDYSASTPEELSLDLPAQSYSEGTNFGLQTDDAADQLIATIDDYITKIKASVDAGYDAVDTSKAFVSSEVQNMGIDKFIDSVQESVKSLTQTVDDFKNNTIPQLVSEYKQQSGNISSSATSASETMKSQVSGASTNQ